MVTGGFLGGFKEDLITTEIFVSGASSWIEVVGGDLPMPSQGISGVSFQNQILMTGKNLLNLAMRKTILLYLKQGVGIVLIIIMALPPTWFLISTLLIKLGTCWET